MNYDTLEKETNVSGDLFYKMHQKINACFYSGVGRNCSNSCLCGLLHSSPSNSAYVIYCTLCIFWSHLQKFPLG